MTPMGIQLSRAKGWKMPPHTKKVDRTTPWGNPFVVGMHGTQEKCVELFELLMNGQRWLLPVGDSNVFWEYRSLAYINIHKLKGYNLACWCKIGMPCHRNVLMDLARLA